MSTDTGPLILTRPHEYLLERHTRQVLCRTLKERRALTHLAGRAFIPAFRNPSDAPFFDQVIQPMGHVLLVVLSRWLRENTDGAFVEVIYVRGHIARFDAVTGLTCWDQSTKYFDFDFAKLARAHPFNHAPPLRQLGLMRTVLDLDAEIQYRSLTDYKKVGQPSLPHTLLAFPEGQLPEPRPTRLVQLYAKRSGKPWERAWRELHEKVQVPDEFNPTGYTLVDQALCGREYWSKSLGTYHDLRGFVDRGIYNPMKGRPRRDHEPAAAEIDLFRRLITPDLAAWVSDEDVVDALKRPDQPLTIRGLSQLQVWKPQDTNNPDCFRHTAYGHKVDLWNRHPRWQPPQALESDTSDAIVDAESTAVANDVVDAKDADLVEANTLA